MSTGTTVAECRGAGGIRETLQAQKGKKKNDANPDFDQPPMKLEVDENVFYFRSIKVSQRRGVALIVHLLKCNFRLFPDAARVEDTATFSRLRNERYG